MAEWRAQGEGGARLCRFKSVGGHRGVGLAYLPGWQLGCPVASPVPPGCCVTPRSLGKQATHCNPSHLPFPLQEILPLLCRDLHVVQLKKINHISIMHVCVLSHFSCVRLLVTLWAVACQASHIENEKLAFI